MAVRLADVSERAPEARKSRYTWIKVEGAEYELPKDEIVAWLEKFGNAVSDLTEDKERDSSDSDDTEYFNRIYSIKMDLKTKPPQFLPISGKKIKIYYKGIEKRCVKCFGTGHLKKDCILARKVWMEYVSDLMFETGFDLKMLGDAQKYLEKWRSENVEQTDMMLQACEERDEQNSRDKAQQMMRREGHREDVQNISEILRNQSLSNLPKPNPKLLNDNKEEENEDEEMAWKSLGVLLGKPETTQVALDGEKKKRTYVKKNQKNEGRGASGTAKMKE
jgi:hypothetical protein